MVIRAIIGMSSRLSRPKTLRFSRRFHSEVESNSFFSSKPSSAPTTLTEPSNPKTKNRTASSFFKFAAFTTFAAILGTAGYATYAYTADEVDEKTKTFRSSIDLSLMDSNVTINDLPHLFYTAVMTVPSKAVNSYLSLRRLIEEHVKEIAEPVSDKLLPDMDEMLQQDRVMTLVLDLKETLIFSEWQCRKILPWMAKNVYGQTFIGFGHWFPNHMTPQEGLSHNDGGGRRAGAWHGEGRPPCRHSKWRAVWVYGGYGVLCMVDWGIALAGDPLMIQKLMDKGVRYYLTRRDTKYQDGKHYRDLSKLNRDPSRIIYVSGHALDNCLQPENYVGLSRPEIKGVLANYKGKDIPSEFIERSKRSSMETVLRDFGLCLDQVEEGTGHIPVKSFYVRGSVEETEGQSVESPVLGYA
ncbi:hypothetical protein KSS87_012162 [Heliosperma pusillum]|nr:hypothetical protein KSS87_012162 [Heliosperma pusillum]